MARGGVVSQLIGQELQGHRPVERPVLGEKDLAHAACAEPFADLVLRDALTGDGR